MRLTTTARVAKADVPADVELPHANDGSLVHLLCGACWPLPDQVQRAL